MAFDFKSQETNCMQNLNQIREEMTEIPLIAAAAFVWPLILKPMKQNITKHIISVCLCCVPQHHFCARMVMMIVQSPCISDDSSLQRSKANLKKAPPGL